MKGLLVILSAPSGCGKTTIVDRLLKRHPDWVRSISVTTRPPRLGEKEGKDYYFVGPREFQSLERKGQFLEWARIFGHCYGTRKNKIEDEVEKKDRTVILTIDIQGSRSIRRDWGRKTPLLTIFLLPPSIAALRERLEKRSADSPEEIEKRIRKAEEEIKAAREYDGTVVNLDLEQTVHEIEALIEDFKKNIEQGKRRMPYGVRPVRKVNA